MRKIIFFALVISFLLLSRLNVTYAREYRNPNILFILFDDLGSGDPTCYNPQSKVPTPHIDKLFAEGMHFTDAHSNAAISVPSRYGILTGRYYWRCSNQNVNILKGTKIEENRLTVAEVLERQGYHTACIGKWHQGLKLDGGSWTKPILRGPCDMGFDYFFGIPASLDIPPYCYVENRMAVEAPTERIGSSNWPEFWRAGDIAPNFEMKEVAGRIKDKAAEFLKTHVDTSNNPFFLYFSLTSPHTPHLPPDEWKDKSDALARGDFVAYSDWITGEIINLLDTLNIAENTVVFLTSDNGAHSKTYNNCGHTPHSIYRGQKADIYEAGHRVPLIVRWPNEVEPGSQCNETVCLTDFMATAAAITHFQLPDNSAEDSYNLLRHLLPDRDTVSTVREAIVSRSSKEFLALRKGEWKLAPDNLGSGGFTEPSVVAGEGTLFNIANDMSETNNVYGNHPQIVGELRALLKKYQDDGRSFPLGRKDWFWVPVSGNIHYKEVKIFPSSINQASNKIEIFNLNGKKLLEHNLKNNSVMVRKLSLPAGVYLMKRNRYITRFVIR